MGDRTNCMWIVSKGILFALIGYHVSCRTLCWQGTLMPPLELVDFRHDHSNGNLAGRGAVVTQGGSYHVAIASPISVFLLRGG